MLQSVHGWQKDRSSDSDGMLNPQARGDLGLRLNYAFLLSSSSFPLFIHYSGTTVYTIQYTKWFTHLTIQPYEYGCSSYIVHRTSYIILGSLWDRFDICGFCCGWWGAEFGELITLFNASFGGVETRRSETTTNKHAPVFYMLLVIYYTNSTLSFLPRLLQLLSSGCSLVINRRLELDAPSTILRRCP